MHAVIELMIPFPVIGVTRPNFLILTPICISLGVGSLLLSGHPLSWQLLGIVLLGALMAHVSVNALNEYIDFHSGLDAKTNRTPFSGGSGTLVIQPHLAPHALLVGVISLLITLGCGLYLIQIVGWGLIPIGLLGILIIITYTNWINRNRFLVLIASGFCFGPLMVVGTHYALSGVFSGTALLLSLIPFFLVNNLLLLNQIPDIEADRSVGRNNFAITWSAEKRALLFLGFSLSAYIAIFSGVLMNLIPPASLISLVTTILVYQIYNVIKEKETAQDLLIAGLGKNVLLTLTTPLLLFLGIVIDLVL
jgi:1,4-dihydroxy-2-naphthoate octaprenyltransferase